MLKDSDQTQFDQLLELNSVVYILQLTIYTGLLDTIRLFSMLIIQRI